ncbi:response regulator [Chitinispirillales bacterium ANBcel5]|uniref:response regulator n=1 Tax=Cellulosispirillum alkaliphilum TaxID=3039283 RepID=UPI002A4E7546|nr:response regulator [Chitinispirillales bacterium ANBcel5]
MAYTVLLADDSETIRDVLERTLGMTGLKFDNIYKTANGKEALTIMKQSWVDILFTDINMPQLNGIELVKQMRSDAELKEIPVVIVSTEGSKKRINELKEQGIKGYLRKPFTPERIRDIIVDTLGGWDE